MAAHRNRQYIDNSSLGQLRGGNEYTKCVRPAFHLAVPERAFKYLHKHRQRSVYPVSVSITFSHCLSWPTRTVNPGLSIPPHLRTNLICLQIRMPSGITSNHNSRQDTLKTPIPIISSNLSIPLLRRLRCRVSSE